MDLRLKALGLENETKTEQEDFQRKAKLHFEAAKIFRQLGDEESWK